MNWVDIVLLIVFLVSLWAGWHRGFILGSLDLIAWIGSLIAGYIFYPAMARLLARFLEMGAWLLPIAFIITTLLARILIGFVIRLVTRTLPENANYNPVNKFLGLLPGAVNGWIAAVILSALFLSLPLKDSVTKSTRDSRFASKLAMQSEWANRKLAPVFNDAIKQSMNSLTVHPDSSGSVALPFTHSSPEPRPLLEEQMLLLVNKERTSRGLKPLAADPEMTQVARAHSRDMFARGYFAHHTPDGRDPFDRMESANVRFRTAGENLALAQTLEMAHINLMNSPGHKANILNPAYGRLGIGVLDGGYYGLMISQEFRD